MYLKQKTNLDLQFVSLSSFFGYFALCSFFSAEGKLLELLHFGDWRVLASGVFHYLFDRPGAVLE